MSKGEVRNFNQPGQNPGSGVKMAGGRNRLTGGVANTGTTKIAGPKGGSKNNGDAMQGSYSADKIAAAGGVQMQNQLRKAGKAPIDAHGSENQKGGPFKGFNMATERGKLSESEAQQRLSERQTPKGEFGGLKGQSGAGGSASYVSGN